MDAGTFSSGRGNQQGQEVSENGRARRSKRKKSHRRNRLGKAMAKVVPLSQRPEEDSSIPLLWILSIVADIVDQCTRIPYEVRWTEAPTLWSSSSPRWCWTTFT